MKSYDYRNYIYLRIPKDEYKKFEEELKPYRIDYKYANSSKAISARGVAKNRKRKNIEKIYKTIKNYYFNNLFTQETLTKADIAKITGLSYKTIYNLGKQLNLDSFLKRLQKGDKDALLDLELLLQREYNISL